MNENKHTACDRMKAVLRGKFINEDACFGKEQVSKSTLRN